MPIGGVCSIVNHFWFKAHLKNQNTVRVQYAYTADFVIENYFSL